MSTASTTPHTDVPQLIEQRLDAIDQALLGLLPRQDRLAAVAQVESRIRELAAASPAVTANLPAATQGLALPDGAFSHVATQISASGAHPQFFGLPSGGWTPATQKRRSRLAISAGVLGIFALALLIATPVTYLAVAALEDFLGDVVAIALMAAHGVAVAVGGMAAVGLGICAIVSLRRRRDQLAGHGWAIAGLCTGSLPMLLGCATVLVTALQFGIGQFISVSEVQVANGAVCSSEDESADETGPTRTGISVPRYADQIPQSDMSYSPVQPAGHESPTATTPLPAAQAGNAVPTYPDYPVAPDTVPEPRGEPRPPTEARPTFRPEPPAEPVSMPESAPAISTSVKG
jgi:hypothetical protein